MGAKDIEISLQKTGSRSCCSNQHPISALEMCCVTLIEKMITSYKTNSCLLGGMARSSICSLIDYSRIDACENDVECRHRTFSSRRVLSWRGLSRPRKPRKSPSKIRQRTDEQSESRVLHLTTRDDSTRSHGRKTGSTPVACSSRHRRR